MFHLCFNHVNLGLESHDLAIHVRNLGLCRLQVVSILAGGLLHLSILEGMNEEDSHVKDTA